MRRDYAHAGAEPALEELLCDPIVQLMMRRDGVARRDVERVIEAARRRLSGNRAAGTSRERSRRGSSQAGEDG